MLPNKRLVLALTAAAPVLWLPACSLQARPSLMTPVEPRREIQESNGIRHVRLVDFEAVAAAEQERDIWCWAACTHMVQKFVSQPNAAAAALGNEPLTANAMETPPGMRDRQVSPASVVSPVAPVVESQVEIAERVHGFTEDGDVKVDAANRYEVMCALTPDLPKDPEESFELLWEGLREQVEAQPALLLNPVVSLDKSSVRAIGTEQVVPDRRLWLTDLENGYPLVVLLQEAEDAELGHAWVLIGARYKPPGFFAATWNKVRGMAADWTAGKLAGGSKSWKSAMEETSDRLLPTDYELLEVELCDPWDGTTRVMDSEEFMARLDAAISPSSAKQQLQHWRSVARLRAAEEGR